MDITVSRNEQENKKKGMVVSIILHILLLLLIILPFIRFPIPPPGQSGILVSLGQIDQGEGDDLPDTQNEVVEEVTEEKKVEEVVEKPIEKEEQSRRTASVKETQPNILTSEEKAEIAFKKQKDAEKVRIANIEEQEREAAEAEASRIAEANRKAAEAESKKQYSSLLGGSGKGNTGTAGNQGDPNGDPNAKALVGISTGSGTVGGGLGDRGVLMEPQVNDNSQKTGVVVINICVDAAGQVVSAAYTQLGSTTTDSDLKSKAERSAKEFKFTPSDIEKQCGTVTIDFKVK